MLNAQRPSPQVNLNPRTGALLVLRNGLVKFPQPHCHESFEDELSDDISVFVNGRESDPHATMPATMVHVRVTPK